MRVLLSCVCAVCASAAGTICGVAALAGDANLSATAPATMTPPAAGPASQATSAPVYTAWPFDAKEAARRQDETAKALGLGKELTLDLGGEVKLKLTLIPAGKFLMGSPGTEKERSDNEGPQREVTITRPFYLGLYAVTQEQYHQITGKNPSKVKGPQHPVEFVSWQEAAACCKQLSEKTGQAVRLPTDAQWEYACRAGTTTRYNFGDCLYQGDDPKHDSFDEDVARQAQFGEGAGTVDVGTRKPNAWGLYDMHGNVGQWCADWWEPSYKNAGTVDPAPASMPSDPRNQLRCLRSGGYRTFLIARTIRSAYRAAFPPTYRNPVLGFRVAVDPPGGSADSK